MTVLGLFETHLTVADPDRSAAFYRDVVGWMPAAAVHFEDPDGHVFEPAWMDMAAMARQPA